MYSDPHENGNIAKQNLQIVSGYSWEICRIKLIFLQEQKLPVLGFSLRTPEKDQLTKIRVSERQASIKIRAKSINQEIGKKHKDQ